MNTAYATVATTVARDSRQVGAACVNHPTLDPDAWSMVRNGWPTKEGAKAAAVCRFVCPIRDSCPMVDGPEVRRELIAKGGWFNAAGKFVEGAPGFIEFHISAAFIGKSPSRLTDVIRAQDVKLEMWKGRRFMFEEDVRQLATTNGPSHGTFRMYMLHLLRRETPCAYCAAVVKNIA